MLLRVAWLLIPAAAAWITELGGTLKTDNSGRVTEANFRSTWIDDSDLRRVGALPDLLSLSLAHTRITDLGFRELKTLGSVTDLDLYYAEQIGDGALTVVRNWKQLRRLNLRGTKITDAGVAQLAEHPTLEVLDVGFTLFTDGGFDPLTSMPNLRELAAGGNKITDAGLSFLRSMPKLRRLDLRGTQRTDSGLWAAAVTDRGAESIATLQELEELRLSNAKLSEAALARLKAL
ncbi:MAG TPA: hypothetical protein VES20_18495, partial [Bryobacteraceae bacterium]|nr:hypothetical protein [Bryobacteraceae bacterium]